MKLYVVVGKSAYEYLSQLRVWLSILEAGKYIWNKVIDDFQMMYYCQIYGHTRVNTDSGNGLMSDGTKPSPKQCLLGVIGIQPSASSPNDHMLENKYLSITLSRLLSISQGTIRYGAW